eukprot:5282561-Prorocentrum_lima.AAC.1
MGCLSPSVSNSPRCAALLSALRSLLFWLHAARCSPLAARRSVLSVCCLLPDRCSQLAVSVLFH